MYFVSHSKNIYSDRIGFFFSVFFSVFFLYVFNNKRVLNISEFVFWSRCAVQFDGELQTVE